MSGKVLVVREVVMRPAQRSSHASHDRQRKKMEAQDWGGAVGSLRKPLWWTVAKVEICLLQGLETVLSVPPGRSCLFE